MNNKERLIKLLVDKDINLDINSKWFKIFSQNIYILEEVFKKLDLEEKKGYEICPSIDQVFEAFEDLEYDKIRIVIIGEDPYPDINNAVGKSFCYPKNQEIPKSAKAIKNSLEDFLDFNISDNKFQNFLESISKNSCLMFNMALTIGLSNNKEKTNSRHFKIWEDFFKMIINEINKKENVKFIPLGCTPGDALDKVVNNDNADIYRVYHPAIRFPNQATRENYILFKDANIFEVINNHFKEKYNKKINIESFKEEEINIINKNYKK